MSARRGDWMHEHVEECDTCRGSQVPVDQIASILEVSPVEIDTRALSRRTLAAAQPVLHRYALRRFWRQVAAAIVVALAPLPLVVAYDTALLSVVHSLAATLVPSAIATYFVLSYAAILLFLIAASYAAIPILMARHSWPRLSTTG